MKKTVLILLVIMVSFAGCKKDSKSDDPQGLNPTNVQWGFVLEYTSTTCPICGSAGAPLLSALHEMGNVVAIAAHCNGPTDPMATSIYSGFSTDRPSGGGIPSFWVGDTKVSTNTTEATGAMNTLLSKTPIAGVDLSYSFDGTFMNVKTKTKFFAAGTGDYVLSVYVLEDDIDGSSSAGAYAQPGTGSSYPNDDYKHMYVLRDASMNNVYGENIVTDPTNGQIIEKEYSIIIDSGWNLENTYVAAVIWKYDYTGSPAHSFVNGKEVKN